MYKRQDFDHDGTRHHVTTRQVFRIRGITLHKALAVFVQQITCLLYTSQHFITLDAIARFFMPGRNRRVSYGLRQIGNQNIYATHYVSFN